ncbi:MAG: gliding motility-associated C-terminal domain-containing protein [Crocinitomicaceae bacterium]
MKRLLTVFLFAIAYNFSFAQPACTEYTTTGPNNSGYITTQDPSCAICGPGAAGPWSGAACTGTLVSTVVGPAVTSLTLAYTAVNTNDFATISVDGGGTMSITGVNVGVSGNVIGPYTCNGSFGDVFITVTSTLPFTTVTLLNTGCSSGWVISCPGDLPEAGPDSTTTLCGGTLDLNTMLVGADPGGTWVETTTSGQFNSGTGELDGNGLTPGAYLFEYTVSSCGTNDVAVMTVNVGASGDAGADSTTTLCGGSIDLNTLLNGADPSGNWEEVTSSGQFTPGTGNFDSNGLPPGLYEFLFIVSACGVDDTAFINVDVGTSGAAGLDGTDFICNFAGGSIDLDDLLSGNSGAGTWLETSSSGAFNAGSGVLNTAGLTGGNYTFIYAVPATGPCSPDTADFLISVGNEPTADFEFIIDGQSSDAGATGGCINLPITLSDQSTVSGGGTIAQWNWDYGNFQGSSQQNPPAFNYTSGNTYTIELAVESASGCQDTTTLDIEIFSAPVVTILYNEPTCFGFSDGSITLGLGAGVGTEIYTIEDAQGNVLNTGNSNTANLLNSAWYYMSVDGGNGCIWEDSLFLTEPDPIQPIFNITQPACYGIPTGIAQIDTVLNYTGNYNNLAYFWNPNPGSQGGIGADSTGSMGEGPYTLTINDENGCSSVDDFTITYPPELIFQDFGSEPAYCRQFGYQSGNGVVFASAGGGTPDYDYLWTNLGTGATSTNTTWGGLNPGSYEMTITDNNGCTLTEVMVLDSVNPIADFTILSAQLDANCEGTAPVTVQFGNQSQYFANPNNPSADTTFFWNLNHYNFPSIWTISHDINETFDTTYTGEEIYQACLVAINKNGCTDTTCKDIIVHEQPLLVTPNVFTPGNSGTNDLFTFEILSMAIQDFKCVVVDRWGTKVFEFNSISDAWDGNNQSGNPCNDGVYFYTYEAVFTNGETTAGQGNINLIREK